MYIVDDEEGDESRRNGDIIIGSMCVEIVHGDLTKEQCDAIVNSTNAQLDLTQGS